jgi:hypothetical protein
MAHVRTTREKFEPMKNIFKIIVISLTFGLVMGITALSIAQPPDPPGSHGQGGNMPPGGGMAPVGSGMVILIGMGAAYGAKKIFRAYKNQEE